FRPEICNVPEYLRTDPAYGGGVAQQFRFEDAEETKGAPLGWVARRWDPAVRERFAKLLAALGAALDGRVEGITLPETALNFGSAAPWVPPDFTCEAYCEGIKANMKSARAACPRSVVLQYANFMPGEWLPDDDHGYLRSVYAAACELGVGVG